MTGSSPTGETDLARILESLTVGRRPGEYRVATVGAADAADLAIGSGIEALIREPEAFGETVTVVCDSETADRHGWSSPFAAAWLTIEAHTSMAVVGLTAAIANELAAAHIPCNVLAGFHHDHVLVPADRVDEAIDCLRSLRDATGGRTGSRRPAGGRELRR